MGTPEPVGKGVRRCTFKFYSAASYNESNNGPVTINISDFPEVSDIPTGPTPSLFEIYKFLPPSQFRCRARFTEAQWVHTKGYVFEFWDNAETEMFIVPLFCMTDQLAVHDAGPPRVMECIVDVPLSQYDFKIRTAVLNSLNEKGAFGGYVAATFASGFEDPEEQIKGMIAKWPFEGTIIGDALNETINDYDLVHLSGATAGQTGKVGSHALQIANSAGAVGVEYTGSEVDVPPPWTKVGWFKQTVDPGVNEATSIVRRLGTKCGFSLESNQSGLDLIMVYDDTEAGVRNWETGKSLTTNTWHFFALTYDGASVTLYMDNDDPIYFDVSFQTFKESLRELTFGSNASSTIFPGGTGHYDHWRLYKAVLNTAEIAAIYAAEN
jgi:hypothetical protein